MERFEVKHYNEEPHPTIKGNGFDGLVVGNYREEAEGFVQFINDIISSKGDVMVVHGDYPTAKAWESLQKFAESKGVKFCVEGISNYDIMRNLIEKGISKEC